MIVVILWFYIVFNEVSCECSFPEGLYLFSFPLRALCLVFVEVVSFNVIL